MKAHYLQSPANLVGLLSSLQQVEVNNKKALLIQGFFYYVSAGS